MFHKVARERQGTSGRGRSTHLEVELQVQLGLGLGAGVLEQQGEELGGSGEPPEGEGAELVGAGVGVAGGQDLPDPVHDRVHRDGVAGLEAGDEGAEAVLVGAAEADVPAAAFGLAPLFVEVGVGLDDLGFGDLEHPSDAFGGDEPGHGGVDDVDPVGGQVAGELRDPAGDPDLALPAPGDGPGEREAVLEVEDVGEHVAGRGHAGAAGEGDLAEAEVLHAGRALAADLPQDVPEAPLNVSVGSLGRVGRVDRGPGGEQFQPMHFSEPGSSLGLGRGGQDGLRVEVEKGADHGYDASRLHRQSDPGFTLRSTC